ncbi:EamA family transporter RarD [Desulfotalea psychrophila]|uniref:Related to integral membrane protein (RarD) n=1 Tax=Desulfotalea psychrophila (strain LSv54 / DSM 12343) TaxID=177439 RepID=Q6ANJ9_DESPS|nr:EamA family transporter RarD [Desulfotalea psychrophila]CAG36075.1 related to integral membrane protein (RarD) [Desulfotalea psychrophila LSv54]
MQRYFGVLAATAAFTMWGSLPVFWKQIAMVPSLEVLCHRTVWSLVLTLFIVLAFGRRRKVVAAMTRENVKILTISALLVAANWLLSIWAINSGYIVATSLGYFISPLINVALAYLFFAERLRRAQSLALLLALSAVVYLAVYYGEFPWIALGLAVSFAIYGAMHKRITVSALDALFIETLILALPAAGYLVWLQYRGIGSFFAHGTEVSFFLMGGGVVTTIPLLCFGYAAQHLRLGTLGIFQYLTPSLSLVIGVFLYSEAFPSERMVGFSLIWLALLLYMGEGFFQRYGHARAILDR